jgi:hypothetical protein
MKIKTKRLPFEKVMEKPNDRHKKPLKPLFLLQLVVRVLAIFDLLPTKFTYETHGMEKIKKNEPCLILMNHSSFIDLKIASKIFFPKRYGIVCTCDGFVGKNLLMRLLGCIPTQKFVRDVSLIWDIDYMLKKKKVSVLMYPEASYSFDGTATPLPRKMGVLLKKLNVPVVTVITQGAFARDPLYNCLQKRKVTVRADVTCLATKEELKELSVAELDAKLNEAFSFDNFGYQQENKISISEPFRADGLNRILYKCPHCLAEGQTVGEGVTLTCKNCGKVYTLDEFGFLQAEDAAFNHIPDWYNWEREEVKKELEEGKYRLEKEVSIGVLKNTKALYMVGDGKLTHDENGFKLTGCDGKLSYEQGPLACYSLYSDYYWYEIGDVICIGDMKTLYYCFPQTEQDVVTKTRIATEELFKLNF